MSESQREKSITLIAAAAVLAVAIGLGLNQVGSGLPQEVVRELLLLDLRELMLRQIERSGL